jgi:hypothetical protein
MQMCWTFAEPFRVKSRYDTCRNSGAATIEGDLARPDGANPVPGIIRAHFMNDGRGSYGPKAVENESQLSIQVKKLPDIIPIGWYLLLAAGPGFLLWMRYRRIQA